MTFQNNQSYLKYSKYGNGKIKIICIHGYGASHLSFESLGNLLSKQYTLIAIDLAGFGKSIASKNFDYSIKSQAELVSQLILSLDVVEFFLLGHSYGATVILNIFTQKMLKGKTPIKTLLISPLAYQEKLPFFIKIIKNPILNSLNKYLVPEFIQAKFVLKYLFYNKEKIKKRTINNYAKYYSLNTNRIALNKTAIHLFTKQKENTKIQEEYASISASIFVLYGDKDKVISFKNIQKLNTVLQNSELKILEDCGHIPHEEMPEKTRKYIIKKLHNV